MQLPSVTAQEALGFAEGIRRIFRSLLQRPAVTRNRLRAPGRQARREDIRQIDHPPADSRLTLSRETHQQGDPPYIIIRTIMFPPDTMVSQHFSMIGGKNHKRIFAITFFHCLQYLSHLIINQRDIGIIADLQPFPVILCIIPAGVPRRSAAPVYMPAAKVAVMMDSCSILQFPLPAAGRKEARPD